MTDESSNIPQDSGLVTDIDGNEYKTIKIGTQVWMAENLKVTHFRNGDVIPNVIEHIYWYVLDTPAYCSYGNDLDNTAVFGNLYNWFAIGDKRCIAPIGWHVPTDKDWQLLIDYLGGETMAGRKMKIAGTKHWIFGGSPDYENTNESGFTALPGGCRYMREGFVGIGVSACFCSFTAYKSHHAWIRRLWVHSSHVDRLYRNYLQNGYSVRCVKD